MNDFQALVAGYHTDPTNSEIPKAVNENIPPVSRPAFRLGEELSRARFMVISADSQTEYERDIASYNDVAEKIDSRFGEGTAPKFESAVNDDLNFTLIDPDTGDVHRF